MNKKAFVVLGVLVVLGSVVGAAMYFFSCHRDIFCVEKHEPWLSERLDRSVPLFQAVGPDGKNAARRQILKHLNAHSSRFRKFHGRHKKAGPISCAVVASGSTLSGSGYGPLIDEHTYVFRMNNAPIEGFEADVGSKTTFNVLVNNKQSNIKNYGKHVFAVIWGGPAVIDVLSHQIFRTPLAAEQNKKRLVVEAPKAQRILLFNKRFNDYMMNKWFTPTERVTNIEWPSTGFRTVLLSLHLCNTVDLFGFGPDSQGRWGHYFRKGGLWEAHLPEFQEDWLSALVEHGVVRRYMGKLDQP